jgi:hypothetical protein
MFALEQAMKAQRAFMALTLALDGDGWLMPRPRCFTPGKEIQYPLYRTPGGSQGRSGWLRKISSTPGFDPRTVQPIASHYPELSRSTVLFLSLLITS